MKRSITKIDLVRVTLLTSGKKDGEILPLINDNMTMMAQSLQQLTKRPSCPTSGSSTSSRPSTKPCTTTKRKLENMDMESDSPLSDAKLNRVRHTISDSELEDVVSDVDDVSILMPKGNESEKQVDNSEALDTFVELEAEYDSD
ncbi:hypothetical protein SNE40_019008 [Patella caerulea]|uniref:Uncharacterized protein n=2 Tax=Patella caerulea TaxID=87958 RepID=A0AAN8J615_PATCE